MASQLRFIHKGQNTLSVPHIPHILTLVGTFILIVVLAIPGLPVGFVLTLKKVSLIELHHH